MDKKEWKTVHFNGYDVIDKGNGLSTIVVPEEPNAKPESEPTGFFMRILNWFRKSRVTPYARIRDLADPSDNRRLGLDDMDAGSDGKIAGEIGLKIKF